MQNIFQKLKVEKKKKVESKLIRKAHNNNLLFKDIVSILLHLSLFFRFFASAHYPHHRILIPDKVESLPASLCYLSAFR